MGKSIMGEPLKILFLTDNFSPEVNAPASRTAEHARTWVRRGADVTVITCAPNFPNGKVFSGYKNAWRSVEDIDGIRVVRVKTFITRNSGFVLRTLDFMSFMLSAFCLGLFEKKPDIIIGTSPQFFTVISAWLLACVKRCPFVFELRDLWPASIVTVGALKRGRLTRALETLELFLYRRAASIVSVTHSFKVNLVERGIDQSKIEVFRNGVDTAFFSKKEKCVALAADLGVSGKFVVSYLGTHGMAHDLRNVLGAADLLGNDHNVVFLLVGDGAEKPALLEAAQSLGLENVVFADTLPKSSMPDLWSISDLALVHLKDDAVFESVIPSKIFEAMGTGVPMIIVQPRGEAVELVLESGCGVWVPPANPSLLAEQVSLLSKDKSRLQTMSDAALRAAPLHSRVGIATDLLNVLDRCAKTK